MPAIYIYIYIYADSKQILTTKSELCVLEYDKFTPKDILYNIMIDAQLVRRLVKAYIYI